MTRMIKERWSIDCLRFDIDERARGTALYRVDTGSMIFDFPVFSFEPSGAGRTGRIIGRAWDMMGALVEGKMSEEDIAATRAEMPKLYAGRATKGTLIWARCNRSMRVFEHALEALAAGRQPDIATLARACYLMRNTGLDGNGTFGTRSFLALKDDHPLRQPLAAQMLCAYLMRCFANDLVEHLARARNPKAVALAPQIKRFLGVGNGSALGIVLFVNNHPRLIDRWLAARETAIAAAKALRLGPLGADLGRLDRLLAKAAAFRRQDRMRYDAFASSHLVAEELEAARGRLAELRQADDAAFPLAAFADRCERDFHAETHETLLSILIELVPEIADELSETLIVSEETVVDATMRAGELRDLLRRDYAWALGMDLRPEGASRYVWYKSETAEEPRRGPREEATGAFNLGLDLPRLAQALDAALAADPRARIGRLLLARPDLRSFVARIQALATLRYHSPHMNMMGDDFVPIHVVRLVNVALHGIDKTRDFLNRNLRGVIFHGAPLPEDLKQGADEEWFYPAEPRP
ncbi:MAG: hypothetical protein ACHQAY_06595 [Hyphomicrobiales bacterium]